MEYLSRERGIAQFIDVGSGLPTVRSTHEVAQDVNPDARVVYVDNDPIVLSHGQALLAKNGNTAIVAADARDPAGILEAPQTKALIDFTQPVAVLSVALLQFITVPGHPRQGRDEPGGLPLPRGNRGVVRGLAPDPARDRGLGNGLMRILSRPVLRTSTGHGRQGRRYGPVAAPSRTP